MLLECMLECIFIDHTPCKGIKNSGCISLRCTRQPCGLFVSSTLAVALRPTSLSCLFSVLPHCFPPVCFLYLWVWFHFVTYVCFFYSLDFTYKCIEYLSFFIWQSISSVQSLSYIWLFATPRIAARQASLSITNSWSSLKLMSIELVMPSSHLILGRPLLLLPPIPPSISLLQWVNSSHEVAKVLESQLQHHSFQRNPRADLLQNGLVGSPCSPRDSQEPSPTPQFKSINSSALSLLHSPTLTSIHDDWKNHSLD